MIRILIPILAITAILPVAAWAEPCPGRPDALGTERVLTVDAGSTPMLLNLLRSHKIDPKVLITHRFKLDQVLEAYEVFAHAADNRALKVIIEA